MQVLEPGRDGGLTWDPLEGVDSMRHALRVARDLTSPSPGRGDTEFWNSLAAKLVAALMMVARGTRRTIFDVARVVEDRDFDAWTRARVEGADVVETFLTHESKTLDGVLTTAETMLLPWRFTQPLAGVRPVVHGANTLYLCAPRGELRHYESLFRGALRTVLEEQQGLFDEGRQSRLLLLLDEAATVAPLDDLDQLAATLSGLDVTLVTVAQDFAQLAARWGPRAATIVNNHTSRARPGGAQRPVRALVPARAGRARRALDPAAPPNPGDRPGGRRTPPRDDRATASVVVEPASAGAWRASPLSTISQWPSGTSRARRPSWRLTSGATTIKYCPVDQAGQLLESPEAQAHALPVHPGAPGRGDRGAHRRDRLAPGRRGFPRRVHRRPRRAAR